MKSYIAYGTNGKNLVFDKQGEILAHFEIRGSQELLRIIERGTPVEDPDTQVPYYIDTLEDKEAYK